MSYLYIFEDDARATTNLSCNKTFMLALQRAPLDDTFVLLLATQVVQHVGKAVRVDGFEFQPVNYSLGETVLAFASRCGGGHIHRENHATRRIKRFHGR